MFIFLSKSFLDILHDDDDDDDENIRKACS